MSYCFSSCNKDIVCLAVHLFFQTCYHLWHSFSVLNSSFVSLLYELPWHCLESYDCRADYRSSLPNTGLWDATLAPLSQLLIGWGFFLSVQLPINFLVCCNFCCLCNCSACKHNVQVLQLILVSEQCKRLQCSYCWNKNVSTYGMIHFSIINTDGSFPAPHTPTPIKRHLLHSIGTLL